MCQEALDSFEAAGMTSRGVVIVDGCDGYEDLKVPGNWRVQYSREHLNIGGTMRAVFAQYPDERHYGWVADDLRAITPEFDKRLEERAGKGFLAYSSDGGYLDQSWACRSGQDLCGALCWGGDLVRAVGWWAHPKLTQGMVDVVWCYMLGDFRDRDCGLNPCKPPRTRFTESVEFKHLHFRVGARPEDDTDRLCQAPHVRSDIDFGERWARSDDYRKAVGRINALPLE